MKFEAAHCLDSSYSKCCQRLHGHSYIVELFFRSEHLNVDGMVVDFGQVKDSAAKLIKELDHRLIISASHKLKMKGIRPVVVPYNPTAENMAFHFYEQLKFKMPSLLKVRVHETATGWAEYEGGVDNAS